MPSSAKTTLILALILFAIALVIIIPTVHKMGVDKMIETFRSIAPQYMFAGSQGSQDYSNWDDLKFEIMRVEFNDGVFFQITDLDKARISIDADKVKKITETIFKRKVSDIKRIIHKHLTQEEFGSGYKDAHPDTFSEADQDQYLRLINYGYVGEWCIWTSGHVIFFKG